MIELNMTTTKSDTESGSLPRSKGDEISNPLNNKVVNVNNNNANNSNENVKISPLLYLKQSRLIVFILASILVSITIALSLYFTTKTSTKSPSSSTTTNPTVITSSSSNSFTTLTSCTYFNSRNFNITRAMVVVAHPDDIETIAGGTVAFMVGCNISVSYIITTNGDKGWSKNYSMTSPKLAQIRQGEQINAGRVLNVTNITFLHNEDGRLEGANPITLKMNISQWIRVFKPHVLLTFSSVIDYKVYQFGLMHSDHTASGIAAMNAVWPSCRDYLAFSNLWPQFSTWDVPEVWLFSFTGPLGKGDVLLQLSANLLNLKTAALLKHRSQYDNATQVRQELVQIGNYVAASNNLSANIVAEAFQVVNIL